MKSEYAANEALHMASQKIPVRGNVRIPLQVTYSQTLWGAIGWLGTILSLAGSFLMAFGIVFPAYLMFGIGAVCWLSVAYVKNDWALLALNFGYFAANCIGIYRNI